MYTTIWQNYDDVFPLEFEKYVYEKHPEDIDKALHDYQNKQLRLRKKQMNIPIDENILMLGFIIENDKVQTGYSDTKWKNMNKCLKLFQNSSSVEFFVDDDGEFWTSQRSKDRHYNIRYRKWRKSVDKAQKAKFISKMQRGEGSEEALDKLTVKIGNRIINACKE